MFQYIVIPQHVEYVDLFNDIVDWGLNSFADFDPMNHDDAMQETYLVYLRLAEDQEWLEASVSRWIGYLKGVYRHRILSVIYRGKKTERESVLAEDIAQASGDDITAEDVYTHLAPQTRRRRLSDTHDIYLADLRIDLERGITKALQRHDAQTQEDLVTLMQDVMAGYLKIESAAQHGWNKSYTDKLTRLLREMSTDIYPNYNPPTTDKYAKCLELRKRGLSYRKIARRLGHDESWARDVVAGNINPAGHGLTLRKEQRQAEAMKLQAAGYTYKAICQELGISRSTVHRYLSA